MTKTTEKSAGNKDKYMADLVSGTRKIRETLNGLYKEFLRLGRKVKHLEPVGPMVAEAVNEMIEAEMALKRVVDSGNEWSRQRGASRRAAGLDFPDPSGVNERQWQEWKEEVAPVLEKVLRSGGVRVVRFKPNDAFYRYIEAKKDGRKFTLGLSSLSNLKQVKELQGVLRRWNRLEEIYERMEGIKDPFYSNIHGYVKSVFGSGQGNHLAFHILVDWIRQSGRRVWSSEKSASGRFYDESGSDDIAYQYLQELADATGWSVSTRDGWYFRKRGGSVIFQVQKPSYRPPEHGVIRELSFDVDTSLLKSRGTVVIEPVWEVRGTIDLDDWVKAARLVKGCSRLSQVVESGLNGIEAKIGRALPDWVRRHVKKYVMSRAWTLLTDGKSLQKFRYDLSNGE